MRIGNSEGITVLKRGDVTLTSSSFPFNSIAIPTGCSWVVLTGDGTELQTITGGGPIGSYLLITTASFLTIRRTTGQSGSIWFDSGTLGQTIAGSIPSNTSNMITLNADMAVLLQRQTTTTWLVVNTTEGRDGMPGNQGPQGFQGTQGFQGDPGANGSNGPDGFQGPPGDQGIQGGVGFDGGQGVQGLQGPPGDSGAQGNQGPVGHTGTPC